MVRLKADSRLERCRGVSGTNYLGSVVFRGSVLNDGYYVQL